MPDHGTPEGPSRRRRWLIGLGLAAAIPPIAARGYREYLRRRPDPEAGEPICAPMGERARYVNSFDGTRLYTEELGSGPTLVLIPGWFSNTDHWHYQKKELSSRYRVVSYDQRGHRWSGFQPRQPITLQMLGRDLKAVLDAVAPDGPVVLAGHSMGGMAIISFADLFAGELGSRVKGIALVDTSNEPFGAHVAGGRAMEAIRRPVVEPIFRFGAEHSRLFDWAKHVFVRTSVFLATTRLFGYGSSDSLTLLEYTADMADATGIEGACLAGLGLVSNDRTVSLQPVYESGVPVLVWVGAKDKLTKPGVSQRMACSLPGCEFQVVRNTGHPSFMEAYREFNSALERLAESSFDQKG